MNAYNEGQEPPQPVAGTLPTADDGYVRVPDPNLAAYAPDFLDAVDDLPTYRPTVGCVIPAYNECETISGVLDSLLQQTRLPDAIHVIINLSLIHI